MPRARKWHEPDDDQADGGTQIHPTPGSPSPSIYTFSTEMQIDVTPTPSTLFNLNPLNQLQLDRLQPPSACYSGPSLTAAVASTSTSTLTDFIVKPASPMPPTRTSHGKKRDASYIPRPPNAFILFRSSFIRSQRVPGNVEGNHSTLSKIIGKCWKALPREERERWEREAVIAQAEHRKKYPDWRFRPGANAAAAAKLQIQVKERAVSPVRRKKLVRAHGKEKGKSRGEDDDEDDDDDDEYKEGGMKDKTVDTARERGKAGTRNYGKTTTKNKRKDRRKDATGEKGRGKEKGKEKGQGPEEDEERLAKIAELLVEGVKGRDLEMAIEDWEEARKRKRKRSCESFGGSSEGESSRWRRRTEDLAEPAEEDDKEMDEFDPELEPELDVDIEVDPELEFEGLKDSRGWRDSNSPSSSNFSTAVHGPSTEFPKIPLTHMFKRERTDPEVAAFSPDNVGNTGSNTGSAASSTADDDCQDSWWTTTAAVFEANTAGLGYDPIHTMSFGQGFHTDCGGNDGQDDSPVPGSAAIKWTKTAGGLVTAVVDPFLDAGGETCTTGISDINKQRQNCTAASVSISTLVSAPCPGSSSLEPCSFPIPSLPLSSLSPMSPMSPHSCLSTSVLSSLSTVTTAATSRTPKNTATPAETAENVLDAQQSHSLLYPGPRAVNTQLPHPRAHSYSQPHSHPQSHPHSQLQQPHSHHQPTRSFSSLADWDGTVSASPHRPHSSLHSSIPQPHASDIHTQGQIPISVPSLNSGGSEAKPNMYGLHESAYNLRYYGNISDWQSSYG